MSDPGALPRPRQVTMAAWMIMGGSALVVASVFETITGLHTLETREAVADFLRDAPADGLGLDVSGALTVLRIVSMVAAACATIAAVLGFHLLKRNRGARLGVTVVAVPLFLTGMVIGGFLSSVVAASAVLLWLQPARDWFDGIRERPRPEPPELPTLPPAPPADAEPQRPGPHIGFGTPPATQPSGQPPGQPPPGQPAPGQPAPGQPAPGQPMYGVPPGMPPGPEPADQRPVSVIWACCVTWVLSGLVLIVMATGLALLAADPRRFVDEFHRQNPDLAAQQELTDTAIEVATYLSAGVVAVWALVAIVLAVLVFRRSGWARIALLVSSAGAGALCVVASFGALPMVVPAAVCALTFSLLRRPEVRAWFARA